MQILIEFVTFIHAFLIFKGYNISVIRSDPFIDFLSFLQRKGRPIPPRVCFFFCIDSGFIIWYYIIKYLMGENYVKLGIY